MDAYVLIDNPCSHAKIDARFKPIIADAIANYLSLFGSTLNEVRLMGSVARGEAGPYSDIDFIAVLNTSATEAQLLQLEAWEVELRQKYPPIARVDLEAVAAAGLHPFRRFVFATDSLSLHGTDAYTKHSHPWDRRELALLITPDRGGIIESYRNAVANTAAGNRDTLHFYSRLIGKDILKCYRGIALLRGGQYERSISRICAQLVELLPERSQLFYELLELYAHPSNDQHRLLKVLDAVRSDHTND